MISSGKQKIQILIAIYKSLVNLGPINFRNLFCLASYCNNKPKAEHYPDSNVCRSCRSAITGTTFGNSLFLDMCLILTWRFSPCVYGRAAFRHSSGRSDSWHPASSHLDNWLLSTLTDPLREAVLLAAEDCETFPVLGKMLFSTILR